MSPIPKTETALRIGALFKRKPTTPWSEKELKQYKMLYKAGAFNDVEGLKQIEMYYASERKKKEGGIHRRDLMTFLNNFFGELDRARAFAEGVHRSNRGVIDGRRRKERPASEAEWQRIAALAKAELERFRASVA
jgi:hypothetical protein